MGYEVAGIVYGKGVISVGRHHIVVFSPVFKGVVGIGSGAYGA